MASPTLSQRFNARVMHSLCGLPVLMRERQKIVPRAAGVVVEIGIGTGRNLPLYDPRKVTKLIGVNPPDGLTELIDIDASAPGLDVEIVPEGAENMSLDTHLADTILVTYTLCSIPGVEAAIGEMRRVLKPGGKLLFCEHGRAETQSAARWQDRLDPLWGLCSKGCHINRDPTGLLRAGGFRLQEGARYPIRRVPAVLGFHHVGVMVIG